MNTLHPASETTFQEQAAKIASNVTSRSKGGPGLYPVYVVLDPLCDGGARSDHERLFRLLGLNWQPGNWQPGENGGWAGEVDYSALVAISTLGGVRKIWKWLGPAA